MRPDRGAFRAEFRAPDSPPRCRQRTSTQAVPSLRSPTIGGTLSLHQPGDTGQLSATATFADGTTKDVTAEAAWSCSNCMGMVSVSAGLVTAVGYGSGEIRAAYGGYASWIAVRVAPAGAFLLKGEATDR